MDDTSIFCFLPNSRGLNVPHLIHHDFIFYLPSGKPKDMVFFSCKKLYCKANVEVMYKKGKPTILRLPSEDEHILTNGLDGEIHAPTQEERLVAQTLRKIKQCLELNSPNDKKETYASCIQESLNLLDDEGEENFLGLMPSFEDLEVTIKSWTNKKSSASRNHPASSDDSSYLSNILEKVDGENTNNNCAEKAPTNMNLTEATLQPELDGEIKLPDVFVRMKHIDRALAVRAFRSDNGRITLSSITESEKEQISLSEDQTEAKNIEKDSRPFQCNMCQKCFSSPKKVEKHLREKHRDEDLSYENVPEKVFKTSKTNSRKRGYDNVPIPNESDAGVLSCPFCDKIFKSDKTYKSHMKNKHPDELDEDYEPFADNYEPVEEYEDYDVEDEEYEPTIEEKDHHNTSNIDKFIKYCWDNSLPEPTILNGTRTCPYCQKVLVTRKGYKIHLKKRHKGELESYSANDNSYLENTIENTAQTTPDVIKTAVKENNSQFYDAFKNFLQNGNLGVVDNEVDKQFYCNDCKIQFSTERGLFIHKNTNPAHRKDTVEKSNIYNFPCNICNDKFHTSQALTQHMSCHRKENAGSLIEREAVEPREKSAESSSEIVDDPASITDDASKETKNEKFTEQNFTSFTFACDHCSLKFEKPRGLKVHLKRAHNILEDSKIPTNNLIKDNKSDKVTDQEKLATVNLEDDISVIACDKPGAANLNTTEKVITITELEVNASKFDAITKDLPYSKPKNKEDPLKHSRFKCSLCNNKYRFKHGLTTHMKKEHSKGSNNVITEGDVCVINYDVENKLTTEDDNNIETVDINEDGYITDEDMVIIHKDSSKDLKTSNKSAERSTTKSATPTMTKSATVSTKNCSTADTTDDSNDTDDILWDVVDKITTTATDADDPDDPETIDEVDLSESSDKYLIYIRAGVIIEPNFCAICRIKFPGGQAILMKHIKDNHKFMDLFNCMKCQAKFSFYFEYINHMSLHQTGGHLQMLCPCDICGIKFLGKTKYRKHRKERHEILAFRCDKCDCKYPEQTTLVEHRRTKHGRTPEDEARRVTKRGRGGHQVISKSLVPMHKCDQCPASFLNSEQLSNHRTARHPEEPEILEVTSNSQLQTSSTEKSAHNHQPSVKHKNTLHPHKELIISEVTSNNQQPHFSNTQNLMPSKKIRINFGTGEIQATPVINQATLVKSPTLTVSSQVTLVKKQNPPVNPVQNKTGFVERPFACHKCSESFTSKIVLSLHMQSNHKEENPIFALTAPLHQRHSLPQPLAQQPRIPLVRQQQHPPPFIGRVLLPPPPLRRIVPILPSPPNMTRHGNPGVIATNQIRMPIPTETVTAIGIDEDDQNGTFLYSRESLEEGDLDDDIIADEEDPFLGISNDDTGGLEDDIVDNDIELDTDYHHSDNLKEENIDIHHTPLDQEECILSI